METKKVGIVTLWDNNYGSALQVIATNKILGSYGYRGVLLSRREIFFLGKLKQRFDFHFQRLLVLLHNPKRFFSVLKIIKRLKSSFFSKNEAVNNFVKNNIDFFEGPLSTLKMLGTNNCYSFFLSGSDQVWNYSLGVLDPINYLRFVPSNKRIANSASIGVTISPPNKWLFKKYLNEFRAVSVREKSAQDLVSQWAGVQAKVIVDPCLQLDANAWRTMYKSLSSICKEQNEDYILLYFLNEKSLKAEEALRYYSNAKIKVISIKQNKCCSDSSFKEINPDPLEFIYLIDHAKIVLTDSFHGMVFSLLLNKNFWYFKRNYVHGMDQSTRVLSLLHEMNMEYKYDPSLETIMDRSDICDFVVVNRVLAEKRCESKKYWDYVISLYR